MWTRLAACLLVALVGCDEPRPRVDPDFVDGAVGSVDTDVVDAATADVRGPPDVAATPPDASSPDGSAPDVLPDAHQRPDAAAEDASARDASLEGSVPDGPAPDVFGSVDAVLDGQPDEGVPDGASLDAGALDLGAPPDVGPGAFVTGVARAADHRERVTVSGGDVEAVTGDDGRFELGPLAPGARTLTFAAEAHQSETVDVEVGADGAALDEEVLLYRGTRVSRGRPGRLLFRFDDSWLLWDEGDVLYDTRTDPIARRTLVEQDHEVVIGFAPGEDSVVTRVRTEPGIAGDLYMVPLDGSARTRLLIEAQPWARWVRDRILGMTHTREALSELRSVVPGEPDQQLADGVPWLLVATLAEGEIAWVEGGPVAFDVYRGSVDGARREQLSPADAPASDRLLSTTPGATGVLWLTPDDALWRWEPDGGARHIADDVLDNPRPRFVNDGRLLFWRAGAAGQQALFLYDGQASRLLVDGARGSTFIRVGDTYYVERPGAGLWHGTLDGAGDDIVEGISASFRTAGGGLVAVVDGVAWRVVGDAAERLGGDGLSSLVSAPAGGTAWRQVDLSLWYLPGPGVETPLSLVAQGAPSPERVAEPGGAALYVRGGEGGFYRVPAPALQPTVLFERELTTLTPVDADRALGRDAEQALWQVDPQTGASFGWAREVTTVARSVRGGYVAYVCDRGIFLAPIPPAD